MQGLKNCPASRTKVFKPLIYQGLFAYLSLDGSREVRKIGRAGKEKIKYGISSTFARCTMKNYGIVVVSLMGIQTAIIF